MGERRKIATNLAILILLFGLFLTFTSVGGLRLPDLHSQDSVHHRLPPAQPQLLQPQQIQQPQHLPLQQQPQGQISFGEDCKLSCLGFGQHNGRPLERPNNNCSSYDSMECLKIQALDNRLADWARTVRSPATKQRSLPQEPLKFSDVDTVWDQFWKIALRRVTRSAVAQNDVPEDINKARRHETRFIGTDINSELDVIEDKHAPLFTRKRLKKLIIPMLLVIKIFKLKLLLSLPFILGIVGLKKIVGLAAIILPGLFLYFKLFRHAGGTGGSSFSGLFGSKDAFPQYTPQGVGAATYYHHHDRFDNLGGSGGLNSNSHNGFGFSKPYFDSHSKYYQTRAVSSNSAGFSDAHAAAYSGYYARPTSTDWNVVQRT